MLKSKKLISIIAMVLLVLSTSLSSSVKAASIVSASDRLSDSDLSVVATHNITFTPILNLALNEYFEVVLPSSFGTIAGSGNLTCPGSLTASVIGAPSRQARCTASSGTYNAATTTMTITGVTNPVSAGSYSISITSYTSGGVVKESVNVMVAIISSVSVLASVPSSLTFAIVPLATSTVVNGATTTAASATTSIGFGNLQVGTSSIMGQQLQVTTNANYGFKVTVEQDQNLTSNSGSTIDAFQLGTPPGTPIAWTSPTGVLDSLNTYGHMGFTTDDVSLSGGNPYGSGMWMGFTGATTQEIMYHNGPADGSTQSKGMAKVAYRVQITALQEAGDYANTLTYVATPTY